MYNYINAFDLITLSRWFLLSETRMKPSVHLIPAGSFNWSILDPNVPNVFKISPFSFVTYIFEAPVTINSN